MWRCFRIRQQVAAATRISDTAVTRELLGQELQLWRGRVLADAHRCARLARETAILEETNLAVVEEQLGCRGCCGGTPTASAALRAQLQRWSP